MEGLEWALGCVAVPQQHISAVTSAQNDEEQYPSGLLLHSAELKVIGEDGWHWVSLLKGQTRTSCSSSMETA